MPKAAKIVALEPGSNEPDLSFIPDKPAAIANEVRAIARHLHSIGGSITEADRAQLLEYFRASERIVLMERQMAAVEKTDTNMWLRMSSQMDKTAMLKRQLLRDLSLTRASTSTSASSRKAKEKSGGKWGGVI